MQTKNKSTSTKTNNQKAESDKILTHEETPTQLLKVYKMFITTFLNCRKELNAFIFPDECVWGYAPYC